MKPNLLISVALLFSASAQAAPLRLENIKRIVCEATQSYQADTPNEKTPARGVKIFAPGSIKEVKPKAGAFILTEYDDAADGLTVSGNQQFYFDPIQNGTLKFQFLADWKAFGELKLGVDGKAVGNIDQKQQITDLVCAIETK